MFLKTKKIFFLFTNLLVIIMFTLNFILTIVLRIQPKGQLYCNVRVETAYIL